LPPACPHPPATHTAPPSEGLTGGSKKALRERLQLLSFKSISCRAVTHTTPCPVLKHSAGSCPEAVAAGERRERERERERESESCVSVREHISKPSPHVH